VPEQPATIPIAAVSAPRRDEFRQSGLLLIGAVSALTLVGFLIRLANFDQSLLGDELSTYWIIHGHSLGDVLSSVHSNDEITPPLYFILGWLSLKIGSDPEWVRLPSLLAGTATIPLIYVLGARTVGRAAGLVACAVFAFSPFMIYYSDEARSYARTKGNRLLRAAEWQQVATQPGFVVSDGLLEWVEPGDDKKNAVSHGKSEARAVDREFRDVTFRMARDI